MDSIKVSKPLKTRVCLVGGWYDFMLDATFKTYNDLLNAGGQPPDLILGPWGHNGYMQSLPGLGDFDFGEQGKGNAAADFMGLIKRTMEGADQYIKAYILRKDEWITLESWPPSCKIAEAMTLHLDKDHALNLNPPQEESEFHIQVNPSNPVPTIGGAVWEFPPFLEPGPADQSSLQGRQDVLRFFSEPLGQDYSILGSITAVLWIKCESPLAHFTTKLILEDKDGIQRVLQDGIVKVEGPVHEYRQIRVDMLAIGIRLKKSERLGLEVSWSNFPKYELSQIEGTSIQSIRSNSEQSSYVEISLLK
jgi:putative CocE/NonD family hydrolase